MSSKSYAMKFDFPTSWHHGRGLARKTGSILKSLGCRNTLLVTDKLLVDLGIVEPVMGSLAPSHIDYTLCDEVTVEPTVRLFERLIHKLDLKDFDSVLAEGAGVSSTWQKGLR